MTMSRPDTQNRASTQSQPSVEELLVSIRQAIHGDAKGQLIQQASVPQQQFAEKQAVGATVSGSMNQTRVSLQPANGQASGSTRQHSENFFKLRNQLHELGATSPHALARNTASSPAPLRHTTGANGFAGILSGDARLEDALEKLKRAGLGDPQPDAIDEFRTGDLETDEISDAEYVETQEEYIQEYGYAPEPEQFEEVEDSFSPQTRQAYLEPEPEILQEQHYTPETQTIQHVVQPIVEAAPQVPTQQAPTQQEPVPQMPVPLTSDESAAETSAAFNRLADTIIGNATSGERSIDEITRDLLRPMLQSWLDENLPRLVERLVREEIERVSRWGGK